MRTSIRTWGLLLGLLACGPRIGSPCNNDEDCKDLKAGAYCAKVEICTAACGGSSGDCPSGSTCVAESQRGVCLRSCKGNGDCERNQSCVSAPEGKVCKVKDPLNKAI